MVLYSIKCCFRVPGRRSNESLSSDAMLLGHYLMKFTTCMPSVPYLWGRELRVFELMPRKDPMHPIMPLYMLQFPVFCLSSMGGCYVIS